MGKQYIYTMAGLTKKYGQKEVLKDIWLSFYPGAKIGVLGKNGSGKSTLLKIMAGWETDIDGTARLTEGYTVGYLPQEPQLDPKLTVVENVQLAVTGKRAVLDRYAEINQLLAETVDPDRLEKLCDELERVQSQIEV